MSSKRINTIAYRLLLSVVVFSSLVTILSSGVLLYINYNEDLRDIEDSIQHINRTHVPGIAASLWVMDKQQLEAQLKGILNIPYIEYLEIKHKGDLIASVGNIRSKRTINREFPVRYTIGSKDMDMGSLHVYAGLDGVYDELLAKMRLRLLFQGVQIFLVSVFILFIVRSLITKRLSIIADHVFRLETGSLDSPLVLKSPPVFRSEDELDHVAKAITAMSTKLEGAFSALETELEKRKVAEGALAEEKERLTVTLRSIGDGVITTDTAGSVVLMNKVAENMTGMHQEEAFGRPFDEVFHIVDERTGERCESPVQKVLETGVIVGLANHTALISRDGTKRIIADSGAPIRDLESRIRGVVLVFRDITEKQKTEEELLKSQKLESLGVLAGGIAHDFNNLLTAILGNISLAKMYSEPSEKAFARLAEAEKATLKTKDLTQQLLTFSRGGAPIKKTTSIVDIIRDTSSFAVSGSNVRCALSLPNDLWQVEADPGQISQVMQNLVINATEAMPGGGIISISCMNVRLAPGNPMRLKGGRYVEIKVKDQGIGIKKEYLSKVFDPYFTTKQKGSGLGLAMSYSIVNKHDGHISADSTDGEGTTFTVYIPASDKKIQTNVNGHEAIIKGSGRILVMDDEDMVLDTAIAMLENMGYIVETVKDGSDAVEKYRTARDEGSPFHAVIMDLTIPGGMGGKETVQRLLAIDPSVKAIVSSGYSNDPIMANYREYGFRGVLIKPYRHIELNDILQNVI
ncbi:MAG: PAS domain S-box protein [Nitrospirae bacterium]|nr:PAS domain S-box protein [Nitrospirota bacterium]